VCQAWGAYLRGDADATATLASQGRSKLGGDDKLLNSVSQLELALADWLRGRLDDAERLLSSAIGQWRPIGPPFLTAARYQELAQVQRAQGRLDAALATYQEALEITTPAGRRALPAAGATHVGLAEVAYQRNKLDAALQHLTDGIPLCRQFAYSPPLATGLATLAWVRQAGGDAAGALAAMGEAGQAGLSPQVVNLLNPVPSQRARLLLAQGDTAAAARWAQQFRGAATGHPKVLPARLGAVCQGIRPSWRARATASVRLAAPSLPSTWVTCFLTVSSATTRSRAMR
jgi:LuxR family maltose regulon positive regulatory protein